MLGQTLGHYRIDARLGAGGMGVVYRAHDTRLERTVAVKLIGEEIPADDSSRQRLLREARSASALNHPHVCTVHEVGEADGHTFIVMEYVEGRQLSDLVPVGGLPADVAIRYGIQIADALAHAHRHGIVHRDLKAANVVITPEGRAKVLDFGLSKRLPPEELEEAQTKTGKSLTEGGQVVGTLHYLAPESLRGEPADVRTDIWALGVLLHNLASGGLPFEGKTRYEVTAAILGQPPAPLPARVPAGLRAVIQRCLAKEPSQRYQQAVEVRAVLEALQSGSDVVPPSPVRLSPTRRKLLWGALGAVVLVAAAIATRFVIAPTEIDSVAVLPFTNVGGDPNTEYASDGIAESVIGRLSQLPGMRVIAFSSVARYKGSNVDLQAVAKDLTVGALVVGRLVTQGDRFTISAELVSTRDRSRMWGEQYDTKKTDILGVQQEISSRIADRLRGRLSTADEKRLKKRYTENSAAYEAYLKGRYYWYKFTPEGYEKSLEYYRDAIQKDPAYAMAYAGLADTYVTMAVEGLQPPQDALQNAEVAAAKAMEIDDSLAESHFSMASIKDAKYWDWPAAEKEYRRALEINPNYVPARRFYAQRLRCFERRRDEAISEMRLAQESDPLNVETNKTLGAVFYWAGHFDPAIEQYRKTLELDPNAASVHDLLGDVYARKGLFAEAVAEKEKAFKLYGDDDAAALLRREYAASGYRKAVQTLARRTLDVLNERSKEGYVSPMAYAYVYADLEDKDSTFAWLQKAYEERAPWLLYVRADPQFEGLRSDPRFAELVQRWGIPTG
jgi:serine/threonine protein kinase/tetratricopeptide (TPR) repeat protein